MEGLRVDGAVVFWSLSKYTSRDVLNINLRQLGINEVEQRTAMSVLQDAIEDVHGIDSQILVRPLHRGKGKGYCVVRESKGATENDYAILCSYTLGDDETITAHAGEHGYGDPEAVRKRFAVLRDTLKPQQVSAMLLVNLRKMGGIRLNPNGFAYWVPEDAKPKWQELAHGVAEASFATSTFYTIGHKFDEEGLLAVKDALIRDVQQEIEEINKDVESGKLRIRALDGRAEQAQALRGKIERYEGMLGEALSEIKDQAVEAHFAAAQASLMQAVAREQKRVEKAEAALRELGVEIGSEGNG